MTREEKLEIIADILEVDTEELLRDDVLENYETWDSIAVLEVISVMNEKFNKFPHASEIQEYKTVTSLLEHME
jgi:acyl carrier protein